MRGFRRDHLPRVDSIVFHDDDGTRIGELSSHTVATIGELAARNGLTYPQVIEQAVLNEQYIEDAFDRGMKIMRVTKPGPIGRLLGHPPKQQFLELD